MMIDDEFWRRIWLWVMMRLKLVVIGWQFQWPCRWWTQSEAESLRNRQTRTSPSFLPLLLSFTHLKQDLYFVLVSLHPLSLHFPCSLSLVRSISSLIWSLCDAIICMIQVTSWMATPTFFSQWRFEWIAPSFDWSDESSIVSFCRTSSRTVRWSHATRVSPSRPLMALSAPFAPSPTLSSDKLIIYSHWDEFMPMPWIILTVGERPDDCCTH